MPGISPFYNSPTSINPAPYYRPGNPTPSQVAPTTPSTPSTTVPTGEYQPPESTGGSASTSGVGGGYIGGGGASAGASGSSGSWWDTLTQAVSDSGIGMPFGGTLWDGW